MINIVAGGPKELIPDLKQIANENPDAKWVGVDAGAIYLLEMGIIPSKVNGDFDSVTDEQLTIIKNRISNIEIVKPEKDETDLEAALKWATQQDAFSITIFGATGGRLDHTFSNIMLMAKVAENRQVRMVDRQNEIFVIAAPGFGNPEHLPVKFAFYKNDMKYISFLPISETAEGVTLSGFKYPLEQKTLKRYHSLGVSNEILAEVGYISFSKGICLVVRSKD